MSLEPVLRVFDNPIRLAQARRRLRRKQALPTLVVIALICLCAMLFAAASPSEPAADVWRGTRDLLLGAIAILLCLRGTAQVSTTLAEDRESRLLDFHRATPTSAWTDAFGYAAGCTAREYASALVIVPFFLVASVSAGGSLLSAFLALYVVLNTALMCHVYGMFMGLTARGRRAGQSTLAMLVALAFVGFPLASVEHVAIGHLTPFPALLSLGYLEMGRDSVAQLSFFGVRCSHVTFTLVLQGYLFVFFVWAAARKLRAESAHAFSRSGALVFFALTALFLVGPAWAGLGEARVLAVALTVFLIGGVLLASALTISLVPSFLESLRAIRRARRFQRRARWLETGASAWPLVPGFFLLLAGGGALLLERGHLAGLPVRASLGSPEAALAALGCLAFLAFEVGVFEYFQLQWRKASRSGVFLVAFVSLALPWILGSASSPLLGDSGISHFLFATSPLYALGVPVRALAARVAGTPVTIFSLRIAWSLLVTCGVAGVFWAAALRARWRIEAREIASGDLPSIDAYRTAG